MGFEVFNYYYNIMIIYKQKNITHFDDILFDNTTVYKWLIFGVMLN